jgi:hypothetical protein
MAIEGVDYAGSRPSPAGLFAAGKRFAVRYGGPGGSWKHLTKAEAGSLTAAGLSLVANAEGTADGLLGGRAAGVAWARAADEHFRDIGMPANRPIYLSLDIDPRPLTGGQWAAVDAALDGAADVLGRGRVGIYGGHAAIARYAANRKAVWYWQTYAWSGGRWHDRNHLEQYRNGVTMAGGQVDLCRALTADYGQWGQPTVEDDMNNAQNNALSDAWAVSEALRSGGNAPASSTDTAGPVWLVEQVKKMTAELAAIRASLGDLDEHAVAAAVLAVLTPQAIAAAIPAELAGQVADELATRLQN